MLASAALGYLYTPADLYKDFPDIDKYRDDYGGFGDGLFKDKTIMEKLNLKLENENGVAYYEGKAWNEGLLMDSLEDGKRAIWCTQNKVFTTTGHYIELELKDGKIWLNDPNGANYKSLEPTLKNILENGCTPEEFRKYGGRFYIFDVANSDEAGKNFTGEKSNEELIDEILKEGSQVSPIINTSPRTRTITTKSIEKVPEIPLYDQRLYGDVSLFGQGNLAEDGCGIFAYSATLQYLLDDPSLTPERLAKMYEGTYSGDWGTSGKLFDETPRDYGLTVEKYYPWEGWINTNKIQTALKNGQPVIAYVGPKTGLTGSGHYIVLTGMTEDGKVLVRDSNGANYEKSSLKDKYENGFDIETFSKDPNGGFWIFPSKESINKDNTDTKIEISTQNNKVTETKPTRTRTTIPVTPTISPRTRTITRTTTRTTTSSQSNDATIINPKWPSGYLDYRLGILDWNDGQNQIRETWCNLDVRTSDAIKFTILSLGKDEGYWMREDSAQMLGNKVCIAADIGSWFGSTEGATFKPGDTCESSFGTGVIMDLCGEAVEARKGNRNNAANQKIDIWYDIYAMPYADESNKSKSYTDSNRYYQSNSSWEDFFKRYPNKKPETPEPVTDWAEYFKDPEGYFKDSNNKTESTNKQTTPTVQPDSPTTTVKPTTEPTANPATRATTKPTTEPVTKPTTETTTEPTTKPVTKPTTEPSTKPSIPSINEPENTQLPVMQRTPEAILKAVQNIENTENSSEYICNILHLSGFFTEEEMNTYKSFDISEICKQLDERGWEMVTNTSELKNGDIIIVNNGEEIRVYAGNNSWYTEGSTEMQQGNENWDENISWVAYRAN